MKYSKAIKREMRGLPPKKPCRKLTDEQEVRKMINGEEVIEDVMNGRRLCPQMTYIKQ